MSQQTEVITVDPRLIGRILEAPTEISQAVASEAQKQLPPEPPLPRRATLFEETVDVMEVALGYNPLDYTRTMGKVAHVMHFPAKKLPAPYRKHVAEAKVPETVEGELVEDIPSPLVMARKKLAITQGAAAGEIPKQQTKENNT